MNNGRRRKIVQKIKRLANTLDKHTPQMEVKIKGFKIELIRHSDEPLYKPLYGCRIRTKWTKKDKDYHLVLMRDDYLKKQQLFNILNNRQIFKEGIVYGTGK